MESHARKVQRLVQQLEDRTYGYVWKTIVGQTPTSGPDDIEAAILELQSAPYSSARELAREIEEKNIVSARYYLFEQYQQSEPGQRAIQAYLAEKEAILQKAREAEALRAEQEYKAQFWAWNDPRWKSLGETPAEAVRYSGWDFWEKLLRQAGFEGEIYRTIEVEAGIGADGLPYYGTTHDLSEAAKRAIDILRSKGYDFRRKHPDRDTYNTYWGFFTPDGKVQEIKIEGDDGSANFFRALMFVSPVWLGPLAGALSVPAPVLSAGIRIAAGADPLKAITGAALPVVAQTIMPSVSVLPDTGFDEVIPGIFEPVELPPELLPPEPLPIFEPVALPVALPPVLAPELPPPELPPELLSELAASMLTPPQLPAVPMLPTIDPGVPTMDDIFPAFDDYYNVGSGFDFGGGIDFDTLDPIPTVDAGDWFVGPMPMPDFPAVAEDIFEDSIDGITTQDDIRDLITVGDIGTVTVDQVANYVGTGGSGGIVEAGGTGGTVVEIIKEATGAMVAALGLVQAYRALTSKPAPNPVVQARQGANTVRANPNGTITTTAPDGTTRTARPPVGQPQMATDGSMIVNNGDGTYTRIAADGGSVINRYPPQITERFGAAASSPYTLPLLLAGGAALVLFATRKR